MPLVGGLAAGDGEPDTQALFLDGEVLYRGRGRRGAARRAGAHGRLAGLRADRPRLGDHERRGQRRLRARRRAGARAAEGRPRNAHGRAAARAARGGVLAGLVIDENRSEYRRGDYLMRGLVGVDEETGALAVGEAVRVGQTLALPRPRRATRPTTTCARTSRPRWTASGPPAALLFTCNGRGTNMFSAPDHDARAVGEAARRRLRWPASSARARSARSAASRSCTASPRPPAIFLES